MYFLRRQSNPNFHPHLLHPALAHMLAQEEAMKCGSSTSKQQRKMHCRTSPRSNRIHRVDEKDHVVIVKDLPGVKTEDLTVEFDTHHGYLHVQGERTRGSTAPYKFEHKFMVDEKLMDVSHISVTLVDGVLEINVPKKMVTEEPRRVAVVAGAPNRDEDASSNSNVGFTIDVPGIKIDALKVEIDDDKLSVTGERVHSTHGGASSIFNRAFALNSKRVDTNHLEAFLEDGVLVIRVPTKAPEAPRRIPVNGVQVSEEEEKSSSVDETAVENQDEDVEGFVDAGMEEEEETVPSGFVNESTERNTDPQDEEENASGGTSSSSVASESEFEVVPETVQEEDE